MSKGEEYLQKLMNLVQDFIKKNTEEFKSFNEKNCPSPQKWNTSKKTVKNFGQKDKGVSWKCLGVKSQIVEYP